MNQPLDDFGAKIGGARKDLRGTFRIDDIDGMTHIERTKLVRKDMVWPTPDFLAMVGAGCEKRAAAAIKMLRDALPSAPTVRGQSDEAQYREACVLYVEAINAISSAIAESKSLVELGAALRNSPRIREQFGSFEVRGTALVLIPNLKTETFSKAGISKFAITQALQTAANCSLDYDAEAMLRKNPDWPDGTSRAAAAIRKAHASMERRPNGGWEVTFHGGFVREGMADYYSWRTPFAEVIGKTYETKQAGMDALKEAAEAVFKEKRDALKEKRDAILGKHTHDTSKLSMYRIGPDARRGAPASGESYLRDFAMRGGEFGLWLNQVERQQVLDRGYDAFGDLASVINADPDRISLGGSLAVAFGARGTGGLDAAAAHYEPGRKVINLTKPHGEGCLSHEWAHALDHFLGDRAAKIGLPITREGGVAWLSGCKFSTEDIANVAAEHQAEAGHLEDLLKQMRKVWEKQVPVSQGEEVTRWRNRRDKALEDVVSGMPRTVEHLKETLRRNKAIDVEAQGQKIAEILAPLGTLEGAKQHEETLPRIMEAIRSIVGRKGRLKWIEDELTARCGNVAFYDERMATAALPENANLTRTVPTDYARECAAIDQQLGKKTPYYAQNKEMFARAFESVVSDELNSKEQRNPFLVWGAHNQAYPTGADREALRTSLLTSVRRFAGTLPGVSTTASAKEATEHVPLEANHDDPAPGDQAMLDLVSTAQVANPIVNASNAKAAEVAAMAKEVTQSDLDPGESSRRFESLSAAEPGVFMAARHGGWFHFRGPNARRVAALLLQHGIGVGEGNGRFAAYIGAPERVDELLSKEGLFPIVFNSMGTLDAVSQWSPAEKEPEVAEIAVPARTPQRSLPSM